MRMTISTTVVVVLVFARVAVVVGHFVGCGGDDLRLVVG